MAQRPEGITVLFYFAFVVTAIGGLVASLTHGTVDANYITIPLLGISVAAFTAQLFVGELKLFLIILPFQVTAVVVAASLLDSIAPVLGLSLVITLLLSTGIRLPLRFSMPIAGGIMGFQALLWDSGSFALWDRLGILSLQLIVCGFCGVTVYYREALVNSRDELRQQRALIENVSNANESFVEHLPEMRRQSAEAERLRITRELHDTIGYSMTNIISIMNASHYLFETDPAKVREYCSRTKALAVTTLEETRATLYRLRSVEDQTPQDVSEFFNKLCHDFEQATGVIAECHTGNLGRTLSSRVFHTLLRGVQVGFVNALRHGKATRVRLYFWIDKSELQMTIWNNTLTARLASTDTRQGIGLLGIYERLSELGGSVHSHGTGDGYSLTITIPRKELGLGRTTDHDR